MSRSSSLRLMSLPGILGSVLQIIGCFLPFTIWRDGLNQTTLQADSLWISLVHTITMPIPSSYLAGQFVRIVFILLFLLAVLIPLLTALAGLCNKWLRFFLGPGLVFVLLGWLEVGIYALVDFLFNGFCGPEAMSAADCTLVIAGPGLWLTFCGFLLSVCVIASTTLYKQKRSRFTTKMNESKKEGGCL